MKLPTKVQIRAALLILLVFTATWVSRRLQADSGSCGGQPITLPFMDVAGNLFFCQIAEAYFSGLTNGTSATTYSPSDPVPREQMAAFITRTMDQSIKRSSRRVGLNQWWSHRRVIDEVLNVNGPFTDVVDDGKDLWLVGSGLVLHIRPGMSSAIFGRFMSAAETAVAIGTSHVYFAGGSSLSFTNSTQDNGDFSLNLVSNQFSPNLTCLTFDGEFVWTGSSAGVIGKVSIANNSVQTARTGLGALAGMVYDGNNVWVTEAGNPSGHIYRLNSDGATSLTVTTGANPKRPIFDGTNIWVPNQASNTLNVIRASSGVVLATLSENGLDGPTACAFDGERIAVTNYNGGTVSFWKAADLSPLGFITVVGPDFQLFGICGDGVSFYATSLQALSRF